MDAVVVEDRAFTSTSALPLSKRGGASSSSCSLGVMLAEGGMTREEEEDMESTGKKEPGKESVPVEGERAGKEVCSVTLPPPLKMPVLLLGVGATTGAGSAAPTPDAPFFFKRFRLVFQGFTATSSSTGCGNPPWVTVAAAGVENTASSSKWGGCC